MSDSSSSCWSCLHGHGHGTTSTLVVLFLFMVLSAVVVAFDSRMQPSWFSSSSSHVAYDSSALYPRARRSGAGGGDALSATSYNYGGGGGGGGDQNSSRHEEVRVDLVRGDGFEFLPNGSAGFDRDHVSIPPVNAAPSSAPAPEPASLEQPISNDPIPLPQKQQKRDVKLGRVELGLAGARAAIREAIRNRDNRPPIFDRDYVPVGPVYRNAYAFHRSYLEMEKLFKVYVYEEGEPPVFHDGPCHSIYSSEGRFIHGMEMENRLRTRDPERAHVYFLPFSVAKMVKLIYEPNSHNMEPLRRTVSDYVNVLASKYPYWNRSLGADHFMLSCHDWGPYVSLAHRELFSNSIRVLCNANTSEGFNPAKDVSLPEINLRADTITGFIGGPSASHRPILAFFAGGDHGPVRPLLLEHWRGKDDDIRVSEYLPKGVSYIDMMRKSKYCLCPSGYEVASPRIVEAIYVECVPVTIGDHYVLPFSDVINWKSFSVQVDVADIPNIKSILSSISPRQYIRMQRRVRIARRHFEVNSPPKRFDVFHMIMHSVWLRRLNVRIRGQEF